MKQLLLILSILALPCLLRPTAALAEEPAADMQVDVGGYALHFHIVKGQGTPILFETGGGDDARVWRDLLPSIAQITGATLITYDRPGFGKSGLDPLRPRMVDNTDDLERALRSLGYDGKTFLVAHSLGGFFATLYAARHPERVLGAVLIDANVACYFTPAFMAASREEDERKRATFKDTRPGLYVQYGEFPHTVELMRETPFPASVPAIDIVAEKTFGNEGDEQRWQACHRAFVDTAANRQSILAYGSGHYVYKENPALVVNAIAKMYATTLDAPSRQVLLERSMTYNLEAANQALRREAQQRHSESSLNTWGYQLLANGDHATAVAVFKLNVLLYPASANTYDSLAEGYEALGDKAQAITNYQRSLRIDPAKEHPKDRLRVLQP
ncbi:alpha/beta fold hydrolase [Dyella subtropica]|uniref:alpha/beta fold hydrolase n=1 Tax=Dyella subtropica TaxID=2992127 RepID=UPI00224FC9BF|nr:alpha/beta fold hydrolase [Dyella subtropica]